MAHQYLPDAGQVPHAIIDQRLPTAREKARLGAIGKVAPVTVTGAREDPEAALANLLQALEELGLIVDSTTGT